MPIEIRLAVPTDYEAVDALIAEAYAFDYGPSSGGSTDGSHLAANRARQFDVWVAVDRNSGEIVGTITTSSRGTQRLHEDARPDELDVRLLGVSPRARRQGIGSQLTEFVTALARERGFSGVFLKSAPHMTPAHRLYEHLGFRRDRARDGLWIGGERVFDLRTYVIDV